MLPALTAAGQSIHPPLALLAQDAKGAKIKDNVTAENAEKRRVSTNSGILEF